MHCTLGLNWSLLDIERIGGNQCLGQRVPTFALNFRTEKKKKEKGTITVVFALALRFSSDAGLPNKTKFKIPLLNIAQVQKHTKKFFYDKLYLLPSFVFKELK